jgi:hypothetical protein
VTVSGVAIAIVGLATLVAIVITLAYVRDPGDDLAPTTTTSCPISKETT